MSLKSIMSYSKFQDSMKYLFCKFKTPLNIANIVLWIHIFIYME